MSGPKPLKRALTCCAIRIRNVEHETCQALLLGALGSGGRLLQSYLCIHSIALAVGSFHEGSGPAIHGDYAITDSQVALRPRGRLSTSLKNTDTTRGSEPQKKENNPPFPVPSVSNPSFPT